MLFIAIAGGLVLVSIVPLLVAARFLDDWADALGRKFPKYERWALDVLETVVLLVFLGLFFGMTKLISFLVVLL